MKKIFNRYFFMLFLICFVMLLCSETVNWIQKTFSRINFDEIALVLSAGPDGIDSGLFWSFFRKVILRTFGWSVVLALLGEIRVKYLRVAIAIFAVSFLIYRVARANIQTGSFFGGSISDFYETYYVAPENVKITFPEKRNVLVVALESLEKVYNNRDLFGENGLIPNITKLEKENISFEKYHSMSGLSHTIAAITGFTTGLPLFYSSYRGVKKMMGVKTGIGTIFRNNGYATYSMFPASGKFSLKSDFLERMGFDTIYDGEAFDKMPHKELHSKPFWGVDDATLFELSKPMITDIIKSKKPYFLFMETINTHCKGYKTNACLDMGFPQNNMEDIARCEDKLVYDFVKWFIKADPTAVIILIDDHQQHSGSIAKKLANVADRPLSNVFINAPALRGTDVNKPVSAMDMFPTIVEAAGGVIDGCRLGLGTSLSKRCEKVQTLREMFSPKELTGKMEQSNNLYYELATGVKR